MQTRMSTPVPSTAVDCDRLKKLIREVPDFPKKGILFYRGIQKLISAC